MVSAAAAAPQPSAAVAPRPALLIELAEVLGLFFLFFVYEIRIVGRSVPVKEELTTTTATIRNHSYFIAVIQLLSSRKASPYLFIFIARFSLLQLSKTTRAQLPLSKEKKIINFYQSRQLTHWPKIPQAFAK